MTSVGMNTEKRGGETEPVFRNMPLAEIPRLYGKMEADDVNFQTLSGKEIYNSKCFALIDFA
jgi:hypothetical protein